METEIPKHYTERFAYIETELFWGEGITAGQLASTFSFSRQIAQKVIDRYREKHPGQMRYDARQRRHLPTASFEPSYIRTTPVAFLNYLRGQALVGLYRKDQDWSDLTVVDVDRWLRPELPIHTTRTVLAALRRQLSVMIDYRKKDLEPGAVTTRVISPHHLVFADDRYHVRSYCHNKGSYLDFVLSRIVHAEIATDEWISEAYDREWREFVEIRLKPNPALPTSVREAALKGFDMIGSGSRNIRTRKALLFYIKRRLLTIDRKYNEPLWCIESPATEAENGAI